MGPVENTQSPPVGQPVRRLGNAQGLVSERELALDLSGYLWLDIAMRRVRIAELKDRLSEHLRAVEKGAEVVVTDRDRPIARIVPLAHAGKRARILPPSRPFSSVRSRRHTPTRWSISSTELLREERKER